MLALRDVSVKVERKIPSFQMLHVRIQRKITFFHDSLVVHSARRFPFPSRLDRGRGDYSKSLVYEQRFGN